MKLFLLKICFLFVVPILLALGASELLLRKIPNDYAYKNEWLKNNANSVNIFCLGSSHIFYGIAPEFFSNKAFNAAHVSQSLKYDNYIFNKFENQMDSLKCLIIGISYFTLISELENGDEDWRTKYYSIYYKSNFHPFEPRYNFELYNFNSKTWNRVIKSMLNIENHITVDSLGFGTQYNYSSRVINIDSVGFCAAKRHTLTISTKLLNSNKESLYSIIDKCSRKKVKVLLLTTPTYQSYYERLNKKQLDITTKICGDLSNKYENVSYINLLRDKRFNKDDFYDADHLNNIGAKKLTIILNDTIRTMNDKLK